VGRLDAKVAVVRGAGSGLGRAQAMAFAAKGPTALENDVGRPVAGDKRGRGLHFMLPVRAQPRRSCGILALAPPFLIRST
jgi:NAD(P)-dependent dehydrogenase (short-subunit alcohol dehydrogenase family)